MLDMAMPRIPRVFEGRQNIEGGRAGQMTFQLFAMYQLGGGTYLRSTWQIYIGLNLQFPN